MLLSHNNVLASVTNAISVENNKLIDFTILKFTSATTDKLAFINIIGNYQIKNSKIMVFKAIVSLNKDKSYGVSRITTQDPDSVFDYKNHSSDFYKAIDAKVKSITNFVKYSITGIDKITFSSTHNYFESHSKIHINITVSGNQPKIETANITYKFNYQDYMIGDFK